MRRYYVMVWKSIVFTALYLEEMYIALFIDFRADMGISKLLRFKSEF